MTFDPNDPRITAYLFDELEPDEKLAFEALLENSSQLRQLMEQTRITVESLQAGFARGPRLRLSKHHRATVRAELNTDSGDSKVTVNGTKSSSNKSRSRWGRIAVACSIAGLLLIPALLFLGPRMRPRMRQTATTQRSPSPTYGPNALEVREMSQAASESQIAELQKNPRADSDSLVELITTTVAPDTWDDVGGSGSIEPFEGNLSLVISNTQEVHDKNSDGKDRAVTGSKDRTVRLWLGQEVAAGEELPVNLAFSADGALPVSELNANVEVEARAVALGVRLKKLEHAGRLGADGRQILRRIQQKLGETADHGVGPGEGGDKYDLIVENDFLRVTDAPRSTFSVDVDTASYAKVRMFLTEHEQLPRPDAVRIEEFINYFPYNYAPPTDERPFAVHQTVATCPWNSKHRLVRIGIKGKEIEQDQRPASNLVFLLDVSGSMDAPNKLPLLKRGMKMLADQLSENDRAAIIVYAGAAGMVLESTTGDHKATIVQALDRLQAGGSTNGGEGIQLAYQTALDHFIPGGVNRVVLCTDGDFNIGTTGTDELVRMVEEKAKQGVFLSVLGFGVGNHNDAMLEQISNKGNGNYAFVDSDMEARKVLVEQMSGTLITIAKDVKIQVEFNPSKVAAYRLIGYENRIMAAQDFNDDTKDAGEIGAGHTVTTLYEIVPAGEKVPGVAVDELKYQTLAQLTAAAAGDELLTLNLRYKQPDGETSKLMTWPLADTERAFNNTDREFQFAASVASFGMLLRGSKYKGNATYGSVLEIASAAAENDESGYRQEFLHLVRKAANLAKGQAN